MEELNVIVLLITTFIIGLILYMIGSLTDKYCKMGLMEGALKQVSSTIMILIIIVFIAILIYNAIIGVI